MKQVFPESGQLHKLGIWTWTPKFLIKTEDFNSFIQCNRIKSFCQLLMNIIRNAISALTGKYYKRPTHCS